MTESALATQVDTAIVEQVVMKGDLGQLTPEQRLEYYRQVCASMGLNPLTRPFDYINLHGKLTLYAKRDAADQLRKIHRISIDKPDVKIEDDLVIVSVTGRDKTGRTDSELGVVYLGRKQGDDKANAILKAITKAKRRLTLSIVGLGWLDETEVETIPNAQPAFPPEHAAVIDERAELAEAERAARELGFEEGIVGNAPVRVSVDPLTPTDNRPDTPPVAVNLAFVPDGITDWPIRRQWTEKAPHVDQWGKLYYLAKQYLGYDDDKHVINTIKLLYPDEDAQARMTYKGAWALLAGHQRSKQEENAESAAQ